jgi:hypothetical protein
VAEGKEVSQGEEQWRALAIHPGEADALQRRLLISDLYVLVAPGAAPPAWQRSEHPSGVAVVRCFLSEASALRDARGLAQVVRVPGRDLFASLGSCPAWVDPEGVPLLLLPAQLRELMTSMPAPPAVGEDSTLEDWFGATDLPSEVRSTWCALLEHFPHVVRAYWLGRETEGRLAHRRFVIVTHPTGRHDTARALDALSAALRANFSGSMRIEAQALVLGELPDAHQCLEGIEPFYSANGSK